MLGLIGEKMGMTQIFDKNGAQVPVTVVRVLPNYVLAVKTADKHGYNAVCLATQPQKASRVNKACLGQFKNAGIEPCKLVSEFRCETPVNVAVGQAISAQSLTVGENLHVWGVSKGRGFQGVMKRHHFGGGNDSHGTSVAHRAPGSTGNNTHPAKVIRGKRMAGHMGDTGVTVRRLKIVGIEAEQNLVLVEGGVPGSRGTAVYLYPMAKDFSERFAKAT